LSDLQGFLRRRATAGVCRANTMRTLGWNQGDRRGRSVSRV